MLDRFDLDFPTGAAPSEVAVKAVEQGLLPWTELTDEERVTLQRLIAWTTFDWPVGESTLSLAFVQSASASGMLDPVWISQTEVTVGLYREVMGALPEPPVDKEAREVYEFMRLRADNPIAFVAPDQVQPFCEKIMAMFDNRIIVRLPIESEWTHALSAGGLPDMDAAPQLARFSAVEDGRLELDKHLANFRSDEKYLTFAPGHNDGFGFGAPVRSYPPNRWLIHDMLGNVGEWVTTTSGRRSAIGGSFFDRHSDDHRAPSRHDQTVALGDVGIRLVVIAAPSGDPAPPP
jgi:formylglycine-generating enzyme required for sulfatase activity